jgi:hypothetical protein
VGNDIGLFSLVGEVHRSRVPSDAVECDGRGWSNSVAQFILLQASRTTFMIVSPIIHRPSVQARGSLSFPRVSHRTGVTQDRRRETVPPFFGLDAPYHMVAPSRFMWCIAGSLRRSLDDRQLKRALSTDVAWGSAGCLPPTSKLRLQRCGTNAELMTDSERLCVSAVRVAGIGNMSPRDSGLLQTRLRHNGLPTRGCPRHHVSVTVTRQRYTQRHEADMHPGRRDRSPRQRELFMYDHIWVFRAPVSGMLSLGGYHKREAKHARSKTAHDTQPSWTLFAPGPRVASSLSCLSCRYLSLLNRKYCRGSVCEALVGRT